MSRCPFCDDYQTPEPDDGDRAVQAWQEVAHMQTAHPDVIAERLGQDVFSSVRFNDDVGDVGGAADQLGRIAVQLERIADILADRR